MLDLLVNWNEWWMRAKNHWFLCIKSFTTPLQNPSWRRKVLFRKLVCLAFVKAGLIDRQQKRSIVIEAATGVRICRPCDFRTCVLGFTLVNQWTISSWRVNDNQMSVGLSYIAPLYVWTTPRSILWIILQQYVLHIGTEAWCYTCIVVYVCVCVNVCVWMCVYWHTYSMVLYVKRHPKYFQSATSAVR